jgi:hypothetical protein
MAVVSMPGKCTGWVSVFMASKSLTLERPPRERANEKEAEGQDDQHGSDEVGLE